MVSEHYPFSPGYISGEKGLGNWYFDYSKVADRIANGYYGTFDKKGIPLVDYSNFYKKCKIPITGESGGLYYTPVTIAHFGFGNLWKYNQSHGSDNLQNFINCAEWFCNNVVRRENCGVWEHLWMEPTYNLNPPWVSAMAQGEALSLLLRAYQCTNAQVFFDSAELAYNSFYIPVKNGGITLWDSDGRVWFEEYPSSTPSYVLNGFIFAVLGLYDYYRVTGDEKCRKLWSDAITSLRERLPLYDTGYWSKYDLLTNTLTSPEYHFLHILQLEVLSALTGDEVLQDYTERWKNYTKSNYCRLRREIGARSTRQYWQNVLKRIIP